MTIPQLFASLAERRETALIAYLTAGFPDLPGSIAALRTAADAGADLLEVGVPFSDPVADGPTIQHAASQALAAGASLQTILAALTEARLQTPVSLMSYLNPLLARGRERLLDEAARAGVKGLIVPDLPAEEADDWRDAARKSDICLTLLVAPTSSDERVARISAACDGFLYYVSVTGITGARNRLPEELPAALDRIRQQTALPVAVGFGISTAEQVRALAPHAEGVVVGSRLVQVLRDGAGQEALLRLGRVVRELKSATSETSESSEPREGE